MVDGNCGPWFFVRVGGEHRSRASRMDSPFLALASAFLCPGCFIRQPDRSLLCSVKIAVYRYLTTLIVVAAAAGAAWFLYQKYVTDPWTRDCQVRANIVGIAPRVSGPIIDILVRDNQEVKAGDLLFEIDPADYKTALDAAKASVANLEANLLQKRQDLERETDLFQRKVASKQEYQNAQNAFSSADAELKAAQANLQQAELNLGYTKVYAPVDGYLTNVNTSPGAYVHAGDQLLALVDSSSFWIAAYFKETQLASIKPGRTVKITLMGYHDEPFEGEVDSVAWGIFVQDGSGGTSTGLLAAVNQTVDWVRLPQRFPVRVRITGKPPIPLRIGQTVTVAVLPKASLTPEGQSKQP
jgi:multidrug resistance efflux pump